MAEGTFSKMNSFLSSIFFILETKYMNKKEFFLFLFLIKLKSFFLN